MSPSCREICGGLVIGVDLNSTSRRVSSSEYFQGIEITNKLTVLSVVDRLEPIQL